VVETNIRAATIDAANGEVMNIVGGSCVTLQHIIQLLHDISEISIKVIFSEKQFGNVGNNFADINDARHIIGYRPLVALPEGLANEFAYTRSLYRTKLRGKRDRVK